MEAIDPAAKTHCATLKKRLVSVPGLPGNTLIFILPPNPKNTLLLNLHRSSKHRTNHIKRKTSLFKTNKKDPETKIGRVDDKLSQGYVTYELNYGICRTRTIKKKTKEREE